ncbi:MAG TPA: L,D-transpeptidase, partial [Syntrophorhabdaceae bacterium]|nr:L,D-transpeptidase [Syntrophorhabdaceae bacterium]
MEKRELNRIYRILTKHLKDTDEAYLIQSIEGQKLFVCREGAIVEEFDASTSRFGTGIRENSFKTPPGLHRICDMIGSGAPEGRVFKGRMDTGIDWDGVTTEENLILGRILRLEGLEQGINKGRGVDSRERYIYIHGTNQEQEIGAPLSHGCIVMRRRDILQLFASVRIGTL